MELLTHSGAVPALQECLWSHEKPLSRKNAAIVLGNIMVPGAEVVEALCKALDKEQDEEVVREVNKALVRICREGTVPSEYLARALSSQASRDVKRLALGRLLQRKAEAREFVESIRPLCSHPFEPIATAAKKFIEEVDAEKNGTERKTRDPSGP
jgi:hypothetical protein